MTNDRPLNILPMVNYHVYWPKIGHLSGTIICFSFGQSVIKYQCIISCIFCQKHNNFLVEEMAVLDYLPPLFATIRNVENMILFIFQRICAINMPTKDSI